MVWDFIILWLKLIGLVFIGNGLLAFIVVLLFHFGFKTATHFKNYKSLSVLCQLLFIALNTYIYIILLRMSLNTFDITVIERKHILLLFIPIFSCNSLLNHISKEYSKEYQFKSSEDFEVMDDFQQKTALQNLMLAKSLKIALGVTFWIQVILLIFPSLQKLIL